MQRVAPRPAPPRHPDRMPPVILLGGGANALSVARQLGRLGATVYGLCDPGAFVRHSRYCRVIDVGSEGTHGVPDDGPPLPVPRERAGVRVLPTEDSSLSTQHFQRPLPRPSPGVPGEGESSPVDEVGDDARSRAWERFLIGERSDSLRGAVLLSCGDAGIQLIAKRRDELAERFLLDDSEPRAQLMMLNKLSTYRAAADAGVPTPKFWVAESAIDLEAVRGELVYPLVVKPRLGHVFEAATGKKLLVVNDYAEVAAAVDAVAETGTGSVLMEKIPGPDDRLCSYYTWLDEDSRPQFHFTKRIIRRYPVMTGAACYHVTDWVPEAAELANRLFAHVGLRGLANVEFKRDDRDGKLKLIECNARFTASDCLVARSGINLAAYVYCRLTQRPLPAMDRFERGMRLWDPVRDFQAHLAMRRAGTITTGQWIKSVCSRQTFAYFNWTDPMPAIARLTLPLRRKMGLAGAD